jgi:hypothetical protein
MVQYISIGSFCASAEMLRVGGRRTQAFPFDYILSSLPMIRHIIEDRCNIFLDKHYLVNRGNETFHSFYCRYLNTPYLRKHYEAYPDELSTIMNLDCCIFRHHNLLDENTYQAFQRRCERFMNAIDNKEQIVFFHVNPYVDDNRDVFEFADSLHEYPFIRVVCMKTIGDGKQIITHGNNCNVYQGYESHEIFEDIE